MPIDFENDYVPLKEAAKQMGIAYQTAYVYCTGGKLDGAHLVRGTKWMIPKKTIKLFLENEIDVKGAFRKDN